MTVGKKRLDEFVGPWIAKAEGKTDAQNRLVCQAVSREDTCVRVCFKVRSGFTLFLSSVLSFPFPCRMITCQSLVKGRENIKSKAKRLITSLLENYDLAEVS